MLTSPASSLSLPLFLQRLFHSLLLSISTPSPCLLRSPRLLSPGPVLLLEALPQTGVGYNFSCYSPQRGSVETITPDRSQGQQSCQVWLRTPQLPLPPHVRQGEQAEVLMEDARAAQRVLTHSSFSSLLLMLMFPSSAC